MAGGEPRQLGSLVCSLVRTLECALCEEEDKELRTLDCCGKQLCLPCIEKIFADEEEKGLHEGTPVCPYCQRNLTRRPEQYPVNKMVQHFQAWAKTLKHRLDEDSKNKCQIGDCTRPVDHQCKRCKQFICHRCSSESCQTADDRHDVVDIEDLVADSREALHRWGVAKEEEINALTSKREQISKQVREYSLHLSAVSDDLLAEEIQKNIALLTEAQKELCEVKSKIEEETVGLNFLRERADNIQETELVYLVNQLDVYEESRKVTFGDYESIMEGDTCYDISESKDGRMLIAKETGLDVYNIDEGSLESVITGKRFFTVEAVDDIIILGVSNSSQRPFKSKIAILNSAYEEIRTWEARYCACDFTMVDGKIYLAVGKRLMDSLDILVYTPTGEGLPGIPWNGGVNAIASVPPSSIVFADDSQHKVYKRRVTARAKDQEWTASVKAPRCLCVDSKGLIWVRSNNNDCITILDKQGQEHQEIMDDKVTKLGTINDMCVYQDYLYVAHETGCGRFPIIYQ